MSDHQERHPAPHISSLSEAAPSAVKSRARSRMTSLSVHAAVDRHNHQKIQLAMSGISSKFLTLNGHLWFAWSSCSRRTLETPSPLFSHSLFRWCLMLVRIRCPAPVGASYHYGDMIEVKFMTTACLGNRPGADSLLLKDTGTLNRRALLP